jgi:secondary thiamine-phosphate synthase enzyme
VWIVTTDSSQGGCVENVETSGPAQETAGLALWGERLQIETGERVQILDLTRRVAEVVARSGVRAGVAHLGSLHTTLGLFVNEPQPALLGDLRSLLEVLVPRGEGWRHDDPRLSDCDRRNADAHLRAILLGTTLAVPVADGRLVLGAFQAVLAAELDGPRERSLYVQVLGCR